MSHAFTLYISLPSSLTFFAHVSVMPLHFKPTCPAIETSMVMSLPRRPNREENPATQKVRKHTERPNDRGHLQV